MDDGDGRLTFGNVLRELRLAAGLSQEMLAERARLSAEGISVLERGARKAPYRETVAMLARALNLSSPERERLEAAAVRPRSQPRRRGSARGEAATNLPRRDNLSPALTSFHGREPELAELARLLDGRRLVTLTGPGGVGKTRLAVEAGLACLEQFADGVWFVDLAALTDAELVVRVVAEVVGAPDVPLQSLFETLVAALRSKQLVLVIDNCEHLVEAVARFAETILPRCPQVRILATSREPLRVSGERRFAVAPLAFPPVNAMLTVDSVQAYPALALFAERAALADSRFRLATEDLASIVAICRQLDGVPLAIELAAARTRLLSPAEIAGRLDARFRLLTAGSRTALARQQTLRAAIDWSYDLLEPQEQALFRRLGVFTGRFGFKAATAVAPEDDAEEFAVLDRLASLIDKSLVVAIGAEAGRHRYRLLESNRLYARERLEAAGETEWLRRRLAEHVRSAAYEIIADGDRDGIRWTDRIEADLDNVRAVLDWAIVEGRDIAFGARLVDELWRYWLDTGKILEVTRLYDRILERESELGDALAGAILLTQGLLVSRRWDVEKGRRSLERALRLLRPLGDEHQVSRVLNGLAITYQEMGDLERAEALFVESLAIARRLANPRALATVLMNLGVLAETQTQTHRADHGRAEALYLECLDIARAHGDAVGQAHVLQNLAELCLVREQYDLAIMYAEESLPLWRAHHNVEYVALSQLLIGTAELARGNNAAARMVLREALPALVALHRGAALVSLFVGFAELALLESRIGEAAQLIGFAQSLSSSQHLSETIHDHVTVKAREHSELLLARARDGMDGAVVDTFIRRGRALTPQEAADLAASV